jgi:hypothetical protein
MREKILPHHFFMELPSNSLHGFTGVIRIGWFKEINKGRTRSLAPFCQQQLVILQKQSYLSGIFK